MKREEWFSHYGRTYAGEIPRHAQCSLYLGIRRNEDPMLREEFDLIDFINGFLVLASAILVLIFCFDVFWG